MKIKGELLKIVNCTDIIEKNLSHVQAPKAVYVNSKIRIYYASRKMTTEGYPQSNIYYSDFDEYFQKIIDSNNYPVLSLGELGEFNEHGNVYFFPFKDKKTNFGFFSGLSRKESTGLETAIGVSTSNLDLESYVKIGPGPLIGNSLYQPMLIGNPFLFKHNGLYYMYYIYGEKWLKSAEKNGEHSRVYKIGLKTGKSIFELNKTYNNIIENILGNEECQATPCVFFKNGIFHMIFCYRSHIDFRKNKNASYKLGYAFSKNLVTWTRLDQNLEIQSTGDWDSDMQCYPSVFKYKNNYFLMYNGNEFGKFAFGIFKLRFKN